MVGADELFEIVWPGLVVEENNLRQQIASLRKIVGAPAIVTVAGRGYRFAADITTDAAAEPQAPATATRKIVQADKLQRNLPPLLGREADLPGVIDRLDETHLLTLIGAGGVGKTRLALEVAHRIGHRYAEGACFVELASLTDPLRVVQAVAAALAVCEETGRSLLETLLVGLRHSELQLAGNDPAVRAGQAGRVG